MRELLSKDARGEVTYANVRSLHSLEGTSLLIYMEAKPIRLKFRHIPVCDLQVCTAYYRLG